MEKFLTPKQICDSLNVSPELVYNEIKLGHLPAIKIGKQYRVSQKNFREYLDRMKVQSIGRRCA
tara:strand:- start:8596 stop:8787 length:192 start_codon:yes stop_codon:yes gene_type:complete